ncbi:MAG: hypothetical protein EBW98_05405, partial [Actinobacteria bacterium]|nr:hypothetical protein [Actinomycetota bacterium]
MQSVVGDHVLGVGQVIHDERPVFASRLLKRGEVGAVHGSVCSQMVSASERGLRREAQTTTRCPRCTYPLSRAAVRAACRPNAPIIAATPTETAARKLKVAWGVYPVVSARDPDVEVSIGAALTAARDKGYVQRGHRVVVCASRLSPRSDADTIWLHT